MRVIVVRADFGRYTAEFKQHGYVAIGWFDSALDDYEKKTIIDKYRYTYPDAGDGRVYQNAGQILRFLTQINERDIVISPYNDGNLLIGKASGTPYFEKDDSIPYYYRIPVIWNKEPLSRYEFSIPLQNTLKSSLTVYNVSQVEEIAVAAGFAKKGDIESKEILYDSEGIYTIIKNRFLELDATEFEYLVSYVLQSIGFEATQEIGRVGDGGIDFEGTLDMMGVASTNLQVQVKRHESKRIGEKEIRSFRGALKKDFQGTFVTLSSFDKKAIKSAADPDRVNINLINGNQFIDIFIEQYDKVLDLMYAEDNDELAGKLKFRKALIPG